MTGNFVLPGARPGGVTYHKRDPVRWNAPLPKGTGEHGDPVALLDQGAGEAFPDEAGAPGDQHSHM